MSTVVRMFRYPRLVIIASYVAIVLGSLGLGMQIAETATLDLLEILSTVTTGLIGISVLHYAYTYESSTV